MLFLRLFVAVLSCRFPTANYLPQVLEEVFGDAELAGEVAARYLQEQSGGRYRFRQQYARWAAACMHECRAEQREPGQWWQSACRVGARLLLSFCLHLLPPCLIAAHLPLCSEAALAAVPAHRCLPADMPPKEAERVRRGLLTLRQNVVLLRNTDDDPESPAGAAAPGAACTSFFPVGGGGGGGEG